MNLTPGNRRNRNSPAKSSDIYSTFVIHKDDEDTEQSQSPNDDPNIFATMLRKPDPTDDDDLNSDDDESLPPLLKRIPKDFDAAAINFDNDYDDDANISGTMIVKSNRNHKSSPSYLRKPQTYDDDDDDDDEDDENENESDFSTFVVRSSAKKERERQVSVSGTIGGTFVRRSGGGGGGGSTMSKAVASMQAANLQEEERKLRKQTSSKVSTSSIPDSVTREDPSTKYELLHELGNCYVLTLLCF